MLKYIAGFITNKGSQMAADGYFGSYISSQWEPIVWLIIFLFATAIIVIGGVNKGIEKTSRVLMPILLLLIIGISIYSLTLSYTDSDGVTRTGLQGMALYLVPNFSNISPKEFFIILMDATGQLFYSISVSMGIMVAYGSYVDDKNNLMKSINQIEIFDTVVALLAGLMIVPAVFVFMGQDGMSAGPGLMFVSLPKVFVNMGTIGTVIGAAFFVMVAFAAVTSSVSVMEAIVSSIIDKYHMSRLKASLLVLAYAVVAGVIVCLGYNKFYFELTLPNGTVGQILDIMDYVSNNIFMPLLAVLTCILFGWITKPKYIIDEVTKNGEKFGRKGIYAVMIRYVAPVFLTLLLFQAFNII